MKWKRYIEGSYPERNERILVSDGENITIVNFIFNEGKKTCVFENPRSEEHNV